MAVYDLEQLLDNIHKSFPPKNKYFSSSLKVKANIWLESKGWSVCKLYRELVSLARCFKSGIREHPGLFALAS